MRPLPARARLLAALCAVLATAGCTYTVAGDGSRAHAPTSAPSGAPSTRAATGTAPMPSRARIGFGDCSQILLVDKIPIPDSLKGKITFGCATLQVPLDYADPDGQQISLQLVRVHDIDATRKAGSLLVNPGGPGGSGIELALGLVSELSPSILAHFDLIGFDPRGVQLSTPINCISDQQKDELNAASPDMLTTAGFDQAKRLAHQVAQQCSAQYGSALAQFNTVNTARDMELIREAVGDQAMDYLGFSYGTELGATYAHLFPDRVGLVVLDGAVDPLTSGIEQAAQQVQGFEDAFDQFADYCAAHSPCSSLGDPRRAVEDVVAAADRQPLTDHGSGRAVTSSLVLTGVLEAMYSKSLWDKLADALIAGRRGDGTGLLTLADQYNQRTNGHYSNIMDANTAVNCNDEKPGPSDATIRATAKKWARAYPMFGAWMSASLFTCQQWQPQRTPVPLPTADGAAHTVLVIGNLHDPATPYQGAVDLTKTLGKAELLSWDGEGHTSYLQGSRCVDGYVNAYLLHGTLPPPDTTCKS